MSHSIDPNDKRLTDLVLHLIPSPMQTKEMISLMRSFLSNIQRAQDSINVTHRDWLNPQNIADEDILLIYKNSYLQALKISESTDMLLIREVLEVSKDLAQRKGTYYLFYLLTNLLLYLIPEVRTHYETLLAQLEDPTLTEDRRKSLLKQIDDYKRETDFVTAQTAINVREEEYMKYAVELSFKGSLFLETIYPFAHPSGWQSNVGALVILQLPQLAQDVFYKRDSFKIRSIYLMRDTTTLRNGVIKDVDKGFYISDPVAAQNASLLPDNIDVANNRIFLHDIIPTYQKSYLTDSIILDVNLKKKVAMTNIINASTIGLDVLSPNTSTTHTVFDNFIQKIDDLYDDFDVNEGLGLIEGGDNQDGLGYQVLYQEIEVKSINTM